MIKVHNFSGDVSMDCSTEPNGTRPLPILDPKTSFQTIKLPNEKDHIKKVIVNSSHIHILNHSGQVFICHQDGTNFYQLNCQDDDLFIDDISSYSEASTLYLVHSRRNKMETLLYGGGETSYDCFGGNKQCLEEDGITEKFTLLYKPERKEGQLTTPQITHIGSCYSFAVMVLDYCDVRIVGQNWINSVKEREWHVSQFVCEKRIKKIECGSFQFIAVFEDDTVMFCGDNFKGQMPHSERDYLHFALDNQMKVADVFGGFDFSVCRLANTTPSPQNYDIYPYQPERKNLKELVKSFSIFTDYNELDAKIRYAKDLFSIELKGGLFHVVSHHLNEGFTVDMSKEFDQKRPMEYHVVNHTQTVVIYQTLLEGNIYPKLFSYQIQSKLTDCSFHFSHLQ